ncbi:Leucine efflux protein [Vibrio aerogenes CECT 7868]|uniref:Leucine efflux protein n=1 Tax=Vibrio aerogenes CECT 7868 TaxID=1216006 RepID=A0A1M5Z516_9VIBR|nr:LysE family translocator [Vibrio aerogenes]SHI19309.1 Leucine efflux protein [Vibrio aerogenes CECT 7868]
MTLTHWLPFFTICLLGAMSPGPSLAIVARHALAGNRLNGLAAAWAHACGIAFYAFITMSGLAIILRQHPTLFQAISYAGAIYLAYLGFRALRSQNGLAAKLESGQQTSVLQSAREGALISLLNPKIALFFIALFSQFVALGHEITGRIIIVATPAVVDGLWYSLVTLLLSSAHVVDRIRSKAVMVDRLSGIVLILLAVRVLFVI